MADKSKQATDPAAAKSGPAPVRPSSSPARLGPKAGQVPVRPSAPPGVVPAVSSGASLYSVDSVMGPLPIYGSNAPGGEAAAGGGSSQAFGSPHNSTATVPKEFFADTAGVRVESTTSSGTKVASDLAQFDTSRLKSKKRESVGGKAVGLLKGAGGYPVDSKKALDPTKKGPAGFVEPSKKGLDPKKVEQPKKDRLISKELPRRTSIVAHWDQARKLASAAQTEQIKKTSVGYKQGGAAQRNADGDVTSTDTDPERQRKTQFSEQAKSGLGPDHWPNLAQLKQLGSLGAVLGAKAVLFGPCHPEPAKPIKAFMYEECVFKVTLDLQNDLYDPYLAVVELWTDARVDRDNEKVQHGIELAYHPSDAPSGSKTPKGHYSFYDKLLFDCVGDYTFTYRYKTISNQDAWTWYSGPLGKLTVKEARAKEFWAQCLRCPDSVQALGPIHIGNQLAANQAQTHGFTHLLNVAEELGQPQGGAGHVIVYHKIGLRQGVAYPIVANKIMEVVELLTSLYRPNNTVLVYSALGFGRAASVLQAFVLAKNPLMSHEESRLNISFKRPFFVHTGLEKIINALYPRLR